jgi:hypothetical protein
VSFSKHFKHRMARTTLYRRGMLSEAGYAHQSARWQGGKRQLDDDIPRGPPVTMFGRSGRPGGLWCRQRTPDNFVTGSAEVVIYLAPRASWPSTAGMVPCRTSGHHHGARGAGIQTKFFALYQDLYASNLLRDVQNILSARTVAGRSRTVDHRPWPPSRLTTICVDLGGGPRLCAPPTNGPGLRLRSPCGRRNPSWRRSNDGRPAWR